MVTKEEKQHKNHTFFFTGNKASEEVANYESGIHKPAYCGTQRKTNL